MVKNVVAIKPNWEDKEHYKEFQIPDNVAMIFYNIQKAAFIRTGDIVEATAFALATFMNTTEAKAAPP